MEFALTELNMADVPSFEDYLACMYPETVEKVCAANYPAAYYLIQSWEDYVLKPEQQRETSASPDWEESTQEYRLSLPSLIPSTESEMPAPRPYTPTKGGSKVPFTEKVFNRFIVRRHGDREDQNIQ